VGSTSARAVVSNRVPFAQISTHTALRSRACGHAPDQVVTVLCRWFRDSHHGSIDRPREQLDIADDLEASTLCLHEERAALSETPGDALRTAHRRASRCRVHRR